MTCSNTRRFQTLLVASALLAACVDRGDKADVANEDSAQGWSEQECDLFIETVTDCYDDFCSDTGDGSESMFCTCWNSGKDLYGQACKCTSLDLYAACDLLESLGAPPQNQENWDCGAATDVVGSMCND